jgi:hypothetical protein
MLDAHSAEELVRQAGISEARLPAKLRTETDAVSQTTLPVRRRTSRTTELLSLSQTTPTFLPELLRAVSDEAFRLANDRVNALDNNPFIRREWLIVSQILHGAAQNMENRFEALFRGI